MSIFGEIISTYDVEQAAVKTLREWTNDYLAEIERKRGLPKKTIPRPPAFESYHGGVDLESWTQDVAPEVMVICKPLGAPEIRGQGGYGQGYDLTVGCLWVGTGSALAERPEDEARAVASYLGAASMLLVQQPTLGALSERLRMTAPPTISLPNPDRRDIALATTQFEVWVATIIEEGEGPLALGQEPEEPYPEGPEVETTSETVKAEPVTEAIH